MAPQESQGGKVVDYHLDARKPRAEQCVQRDMLGRGARQQPQKVFAIFADGERWTYAEMQSKAIRTANALRAFGVKQGERVLVWLPNGAKPLPFGFGSIFPGAFLCRTTPAIAARCSSMR